MNTTPSITTQRDLRRSFWEAHPTASRKRGRDGDYLTDTRVAFCDFVESLARDGFITENLARRATLGEPVKNAPPKEPPPPRYVVRVTMDDGDTFTTSINGTRAEVEAYYRIGTIFNVGLGPDDNMRRVVRLDFI